MTIQWTGFPSAVALTTSDVLVGLAGGTANARFTGASVLKSASNLSEVASKTTSFNNISPLTTKGDLIWFDGTNNARLAVGTLNQILVVGASNALTWVNNPGLLISNNLSDLASAATARTNLALDAGSAVTFTSLTLGASGTAGTLTMFPATATNGTFIISPLNAGGAFNTTIRNSTMSQSTVFSIPDPAQTTAKFLLSDSATVQTVNTGNLALTAGYYVSSNANALTAHSGGGQSSALQLAKQYNRVTTVAAGGNSVKLPAAAAGLSVVVINAAASNAMDCFPSSGDAINALTADTALSIAADSTVIFYCAVAGTWNSIVTA